MGVGRDQFCCHRAALRGAESLIILLDYHMPGIDGFDFMKQIAADGELTKRHAYVALTSDPYSLPGDFLDLLARLRAPVLERPVSLKYLLETIRAAYRQRGDADCA